MSTKYTCIRCLHALRTSSRPTAPLWRPISIRLSSTTSTPKSHQATPAAAKRQISTFQETTPEYDFDYPGKAASLKRRADGKSDVSRLIIGQNDLFHPLSESPIPAMRQRAAFMKAHAYCPHPEHNRTRIALSEEDPERRKPTNGGVPPAHVRFECPHCGVPSFCSEEHWADDYEEHMKICDTLREINEDDHDLRSGRYFEEYDFPDRYLEEAAVNFTNWDTLLFTRGFEAIDQERSLRHTTRLLTYPYTIGSILHEYSPYGLRNRMTPEGLRSFTALRYTLHPPKPGDGPAMKQIKPIPPPVRIFVVGARAESSLPRNVWEQLAYLYRDVTFHVIMIGPESMTNRDDEFPLPDRTMRNPFGAVIEDQFSREMKISTYVDYFHTLHEARHFTPYDPYFDCFVLFHPGLGHPASSHEWEKTVPQLLETKCPVIVTGYTEFDMQRDIDWMQKQVGKEMDILLEPGQNEFRSLKWDMNDLDPQDISAGNWGVWAFRGKRYEAQTRG
ncbi:hypothetical protein BT63DRAFT_452018 [Microthyrium microscopicum]|uniref:Uncharacterized protein n=1 Tax=Microthyrium microscopicum TaxID=703497 RepID=A0A6A6UNZ9_9PEZI|nr:hypothetical protein BT63DRAFT_452018 [Microthyrium microscopicum]